VGVCVSKVKIVALAEAGRLKTRFIPTLSHGEKKIKDETIQANEKSPAWTGDSLVLYNYCLPYYLGGVIV
jgi:hypothetical protein